MKCIDQPRLSFKIILTIIFGICCYFQVRESISKYWKENKSTFVYKRIQKSAKLPILTICAPSVKKPKQFGKSMSNGVYGGISPDFNWPDTKNEIDKLWENHTYSISEFFNTINLMASTPRYRSCAFDKNDILASHDRICLNYSIDCKIEVPSKEDNCSENAIEVRGFPTLFLGICYSLKIMRNFTDEEALYLNLTGYGNQLYLLPEGRQISISTLTWDSRPISFYLQANKELDVIVNPVENREINDGYCDPDISEKDYYDCYRNEIKRAIHSQEMAMKLCDGEENFGNCTVPQLEYFSSTQDGALTCLKPPHAQCAQTIAYHLGRKMTSDTNPCQKPCITDFFNIAESILELPPDDENKTFFGLYMYLASPNVMVHEEYLLFDFNSIIASVGGSMGLFLSFSFLECLLVSYDIIQKLLCSITKSPK